MHSYTSTNTNVSSIFASYKKLDNVKFINNNNKINNNKINNENDKNKNENNDNNSQIPNIKVNFKDLLLKS